MRILRIAIRVMLGFAALGFIGVAAGIVTLAVMYPAGNPQLTAPPVLLLVPVGMFAIGVVGAFVLSAVISVRQRGISRRSAASSGDRSEIDGSRGLAAPGKHDTPLAEFRPTALGLRRGSLPTSSNFPRAQRLAIYADGLEVRNLFGRAWIPSGRILGMYRLPLGFRVIWDADEAEHTATVSDWFAARKITAALEHAGYRFDVD